VSELKPLRPAAVARARRAAAKLQRDRKPLFVKGGRAWINGAEVGGTDPRFAHLNRSYD
jgi:hypothetical protein